MKVNIDISCNYVSFLAHQSSIQFLYETLNINRSFDSFYSQTVLALWTDRLTNPSIKHRNNIIIFARIGPGYSDILEITCKVGIEECKPRTSKLQRNHNNVQSETISDYFKKAVTIPLLDH